MPKAVKKEPKISTIQWCIAIVLFFSSIATWYLFLTKNAYGKRFCSAVYYFNSYVDFHSLYHQIIKFKAGPIEFEKKH